jgi:hypothetical protein
MSPQPDDPGDNARVIYIRDSGEQSMRKVMDGALVLGIVGLVTVIWQMNTTLAILGSQVKYMSEEISLLEGRIK